MKRTCFSIIFTGICCTAGLVSIASTTNAANEIGYIEKFSLAEDRGQALQLLIPGTDDYYYYHMLHHQNSGNTAKYKETLDLWRKRNNGNTPGRAKELINRQALIDYPGNNKSSLDHIIRQLNLKFNHERRVEGKKSTLPTKLDPPIIATENLLKNGLAEKRNLNRLTDAALRRVSAEALSPDQRRNLLSRLRRPDVPKLVEHLAADLKYKNSKGFGSFQIHRHLTLEQLNGLLKLEPKLKNQEAFVSTYLQRLAPGADVDLDRDVEQHRAHLNRVWAFVSSLDPVHNSLKALTLYRRLELERNQGNYDAKRFMDYIKLPRNLHYVNPDWLKNPKNKNYHVNTGLNHPRFGSIGNEEPLVREYLKTLFIDAKNYDAYQPYLRDTFLKKIFAETKIEQGIGNVEKWASMLSPSDYKALKERVDIHLSPQNKAYFDPTEGVEIDVDIKHVKTLLVKVFHINTFNYYRDQQQEIDLAINLDGLVASSEQQFNYPEPPERRVRRNFKFPELKKRGVYVVEFIGNGQSSRALINKGRLHYLVKNTAAGHQFTILNQSNQPVKTASIWLGNREFQPNKQGLITIPFSTDPRTEKIIIRNGELASLGLFHHQQEAYSLNAGIYVDRESLLKGAEATVLVKPVFRVSGVAASLKLLEEVELKIDTTDLQGVKNSKVVKDFKVFENREASYTFKVPDQLASIQFTLSGRVENISLNAKQSLSSAATFQLNGIERSNAVDGFHLTHPEGSYFLELTGKTGEARTGQVIHFEFKNRFYTSTISRSLQTDEQGRCELGALSDIEWVKIKSYDGHQHVWRPQHSQYSFPSELQGPAGQPLHLPLWLDTPDPLAACSLLELRDNTFAKDWHSALRWKDGLLSIDDLPAGDYSLLIRPLGKHLSVRLTDGESKSGYAISTTRKLEQSPEKPAYYQGVKAAKKGITLMVGNSSPTTRVHVYASRYEPEYRIFNQLGFTGLPDLLRMRKTSPVSFYVSGRNIGDEYRYILERKLTKKYPGNMLERPGLLLNPWAVRDTQAGTESLAGGGEYKSKAESPDASMAPKDSAKKSGGTTGNYANLDFLKTPTVALQNLVPDEDGTIFIAAEEIGDKTQLLVTIVEPGSTQTVQVPLRDIALANRDLRLLANLDPTKHYTEQKLISVAAKAKPFVIENVVTSTYEPYDSLPKAYQLLSTLSGNATLRDFAFITGWPDLKPEDKRLQYSKFACHELNFFLYHKDKAFFDGVIANYLKNKKDKTFMDHWLLNEDLGEYLEPWSFSRLNIVERVLLGKRLKKFHPALERHVRELSELIPPNIQEENVWFNTAVATGGLEVKNLFRGYAGKALNGLLVDELAAKKPKAAASVLRKLSENLSSDKLLAEMDSDGIVDAAGEMAAKKGVRQRLARTKEKAAEEDAYIVADFAEERSLGRRFYQKLDSTKEWAENNYYQLRIQEQLAGLVTVNEFWADYAHHTGNGNFLSDGLPAASRNFAEMMMALAVLDLPFKAEEPEIKTEKLRFEVTPKSDMLVFHKEIRESELAKDRPAILVTQHFFRNDDRYRHEGNEKYEKYVTEEFLRHVVYGCQVILTNPTSTPQKLNALLQIPKGAIPVANGFETKGHHVQLGAYSTQTIETYFYFPVIGEYPHYPVHVAKDQQLIAHSDPFTCKVVEKLSKIDKTSWAWISQNGSTAELLAFLDEQNIERLKLEDIAWRMQDAAAFKKIINLLQKRHKYHQTLWMYAIKHNEVAPAREFLQHSSFANQCGMYLDTRLMSLNPIDRHVYQHLEYAPLVNPRAHRVGKEPTILNHPFRKQYQEFMRYLSYKSKLDSTDRLAAAYYLALQDRVEEALTWFAAVQADEVSSKLQYDYMNAYLGLYEAKVDQARAIAERYAKYPVPRWQNKFLNIIRQTTDGQDEPVDPENREQAQEALASTEPALEFTVEADQIQFKYQQLANCTLHFYPMDIELLFSRNPFIQDQSAQFSFIRPVLTREVDLPPDQETFRYELPQQFQRANVMVEATTGGLTRSQAYYANALNVQLIENYGQVRVTHAKEGTPLDTVYVKVYARSKDGTVKFFKDGYTDFRGRFDYVSLNTHEIDQVERFSLLILSDQHGAMIKECAPPKR